MSQFGMQVPGGRIKRGASADVYTGLAAVAVLFLIAAVVVMFTAASKVGKGSPIGLQEPGKIQLPAAQGR
jgi:hypothetical protein